MRGLCFIVVLGGASACDAAADPGSPVPGGPDTDAGGPISGGTTDPDLPTISASSASTSQATTEGDAGSETGQPTSTGALDASSTGGEDTHGDHGPGVPSACGNGVAEAAEACDDGNDDELDGCSSACTVGPVGLSFGAPVLTETGGNVGEKGGNKVHTRTCEDAEVLVGVQGGLSSEGWLGTVAGVCRGSELENTLPPRFMSAGPTTLLPEDGQFSDGGDWAATCPDGQVVLGFRGNAGAVTDGIELLCGSVDTIESAPYELDPVVEGWTGLQGSDGGAPFGPIVCPAGSVATGLQSHTISYVVRMRLLCRTVDFTLPEGG